MTLWGTVVAEYLGFDRDAALTLAKVVTGMNAQSKGQRMGIYETGHAKESIKRFHQRPPGEEYSVGLLGRIVPMVNTDQGPRAISKGEPVKPTSVDRYLKSKFGDSLPDVEAAMKDLAGSMTEEQLTHEAYDYYERLRPQIPAGVKGWGAAGDLDLNLIRSLAQAQKPA